ncbi:hypothetical protein MCOR07_005224 [Pyricularia oryzae]|uniref:Peptidase S9 prolyl oligopeptidase catalytic domain-containing protein n=1 Tax=Pyricularia grisea TaxID=148305 RepID=A0ABQ8NCR5_PYRGI|nr:hypothetical protein MCOR26_002382 [Pyricularia oryzae]KAI6294581.1 hypothetical protein MCOR33_008332 [Pyricularia grisea]KAI6324212.1 hypothetical protein MCOR29_004154 [Pyricularia oryzae]KAI6328108.1 hypothetical protein MCOR34_000256 [Pyricularia oryzae]KAI6346347.1 hypothetical protein MCOR28_002949 [Pyricularia oryzae]
MSAMATKKVAPYGKWESAISIEDATAGAKILSSPRACPLSGRTFFLESLPDGPNTIMEATQASDGSVQVKSVLPEPHTCSTDVYEYGGLPYALVCKKDSPLSIIFSDAKNKALKLLTVDSGEVETIVQSSVLRFADFDPHPQQPSPWILCVEEDHTDPAPDRVRNYVSAIDLDAKTVTRIADTADFYSYPRFSPDGAWVAWREWNHPGLPFKDVKLSWARWTGDQGRLLGEVEVVAGEDGQLVGEVHWAPDGTLFFSHEQTGMEFRQLFTVRPGEGRASVKHFKLEGLEGVEFGDVSWFPGFQTFTFLSTTNMLAVYTKFATSHLIHVDITSQQWTPLDVSLHDMRIDPLCTITESSFLVLGSGHTTPPAVYSVTLTPDAEIKTKTLLHRSTTSTFPEEIFSTPQHIQLESKTSQPARPIHGFLWPPTNPHFTGPDDTPPPLIVGTHGGPTGHCTPGLDMHKQFWTSRGYAVFYINYTGSTAHGRRYRERLFGNWGILDRDDVPEAVEHLASRGLVDRARVGIEGGSAGGYHVLQSLVWHPEVFAGGICYCGVSDVSALAEETHKLESRYMELLVLEPGMTEEEKRTRFRDRSPLYHAERITAPLLLVHGDKDTIVPVSQSVEIRDRVRDKGGDVKLVVLPGDGHEFKKVDNLKLWMEEEVKWWEKTLVR